MGAQVSKKDVGCIGQQQKYSATTVALEESAVLPSEGAAAKCSDVDGKGDVAPTAPAADSQQGEGDGAKKRKSNFGRNSLLQLMLRFKKNQLPTVVGDIAVKKENEETKEVCDGDKNTTGKKHSTIVTFAPDVKTISEGNESDNVSSSEAIQTAATAAKGSKVTDECKSLPTGSSSLPAVPATVEHHQHLTGRSTVTSADLQIRNNNNALDGECLQSHAEHGNPELVAEFFDGDGLEPDGPVNLVALARGIESGVVKLVPSKLVREGLLPPVGSPMTHGVDGTGDLASRQPDVMMGDLLQSDSADNSAYKQSSQLDVPIKTTITVVQPMGSQHGGDPLSSEASTGDGPRWTARLDYSSNGERSERGLPRVE